jgi:hypothetical protein
MPSNLGPTNISETFNGLLHAFGSPIPLAGQQLIYDGYGTPSALRLGANCNGATICGTLSCDNIIINNINLGNGDVIFGDNFIRIQNCTEATLTSTNNALQIGTTADTNLVFDCNEIQARNNNAANTLALNPGGGNVSVGANLVITGTATAVSYNSTSSKRFKSNVVPISNALDILQKLEGVRFDWKETGKSDIGFIAEEVNKVLPEVVLKDENNEPLAIDYGKVTSILIEAVKELVTIINNK